MIRCFSDANKEIYWEYKQAFRFSRFQTKIFFDSPNLQVLDDLQGRLRTITDLGF